MGHTNSTTNYSLPQFVTTDKPAWLTDINGAFSDIDTAIHTAQADATSAGSTASDAATAASNAATAASTADAKGAGAVASIADTFDATATYAVGDLVMYNSLLYKCTTAVVTPGAWTGIANWSRITMETQVNDLISGVNSSISDLQTITDISSSFTKGSAVNGTFYIKAYYDKGTRKVSGSVAVDITSGSISTNQSFMYVANPYRPATDITVVPMMIKTANGWIAYNGSITHDGDCKQYATTSATGIYCTFEYYI